MTKLPQGKGYWVYQLLPVQQLFGESGLKLDGVRADLLAHRPDHMIVKINQDGSRYNLRRLNPNVPIATEDDLLPAYFALLSSLGVEAWGCAGVAKWTRNNPAAAARKIAERAKFLKVQGLIINAEAGFKVGDNRFNSARIFMSELRAQYEGPILFSSYKFPDLHPELPWLQFLDPQYCDGISNQVYWVKAHNPVEQLNQSVAQYQKKSALPFVPAGAAHTEQRPEYRYADGSLWVPSPDDVIDFFNACVDLGFSGCNFWSRWDMHRISGLEETLMVLDWPAAAPAPQPAPAELTDKEKLDRLWMIAEKLGHLDLIK